MKWAKVVNNEAQQIWDTDPSDLWHPDALAFWKEVPDEVQVGWKFKNNKWISGGQWAEEDRIENPLPEVGPPTAIIAYMRGVDLDGSTETVTFANDSSGHYDSFEWNIEGKKYTDETFELKFPRKSDAPYGISVSLTVTGPGGVHTKTLEGEEEIVIAKYDPPYIQ